MKKHVAALAFLLLTLTAERSLSQANREQGIRLNGVVVYASTFAVGRMTAEGFTRVLNIKEDTLETALLNENTGVMLGYELQVEPIDQGTKLRVSIKPLTATAIRGLRESVWVKKLAAKWPNKAVTEPQVLPQYPAPQIINLTDILKLNLWVNAETGATIGDQIRFALDTPQPARDFTLDEVALKLNGFRLLINGEVRNGERSFGGFSGSLPWFYVPGKGRFIVSIQPHAGYGFQKIGVLEHNKLSFSVDGDKYEWITQEPILAYRSKWYLWVLHDAGYQPSPAALADVEIYSKGNCCLYGALSHVTQIANPDK
jgi:hypothetical protein